MGILRGLMVAVTLIISAVVAVFITLAVFQFGQIRSELERELLAVIADRTAMPFRAAASIGLPFSTVRNADGLLERALQTDPGITGVHLLGPEGELVETTSPAAPAVGMAVLRAAMAANEATWSGRIGSDFHFGSQILSPTGQPAGAIVIEYSASGAVTAGWAMTGRLAAAGIAFVVAASALAALLLRTSLARDLKALGEIEAEIDAEERMGWRKGYVPPGGGVANPEGRSGLRELLAQAEARYREALSQSAHPEKSES